MDSQCQMEIEVSGPATALCLHQGDGESSARRRYTRTLTARRPRGDAVTEGPGVRRDEGPAPGGLDVAQHSSGPGHGSAAPEHADARWAPAPGLKSSVAAHLVGNTGPAQEAEASATAD
ncbi:hypothetical protein HPB52_016883 [Rhipicephalus sanguineus]|uniref:Uncharacterized protein n=1 Tax=Rhipicephalus sanguineus TaxID=34632 RepID=A0A9D4T2D0_RHISA|nr:hypothetical protein HPB52_016883 [Rhipicephalus sanguineus]